MTKFKDPKSVVFTVDRRAWRAFKDVCLNQSLETSFVMREFVNNYIEDRRKAEAEYDPYKIPNRDVYDTGEENVSPAEKFNTDNQQETDN